MKAGATTVLVLLLSLSIASAQDEADWDVEGITYYFAAGSHQSGHMTMGLDNTGVNQTDFVGCIHMILRDKPARNDVGRVAVTSKLGDSFMEFDFNTFEGTLPDMDGGIAQDVWVDGSHLHVGEIQHPAVKAGIAAWGRGELLLDTLPYFDPVTGRGEYQASMFVTPHGFRDDETGAIYNTNGTIWEPGQPARRGVDDWEVHLRVESLADTRQPDAIHIETRPQGDVPYFTPTEAYVEHFVFDNIRYGGQGHVTISSEALTQPGDNALAVTLRDPEGVLIDQAVLEPALLSPASASMDFPLDKFGKYIVTVAGKVAMSQYDLRYTMTTPDTFDMDFWWDNTTFARESTRTLHECQDEVGSPTELVDNVVARVPPPVFAWVPIGVGMGAGVLAILVGGKLIHMSWSAGRKL